MTRQPRLLAAHRTEPNDRAAIRGGRFQGPRRCRPASDGIGPGASGLLALLLALTVAAKAGGNPIDHVAKHTAIFTQPAKQVPTPGMPDGPLLGNGDVGVALAGPPDAQRYYIGKNDF